MAAVGPPSKRKRRPGQEAANLGNVNNSDTEGNNSTHCDQAGWLARRALTPLHLALELTPIGIADGSP